MTTAQITEPLMNPQRTKRAPYHVWSSREEITVKRWIRDGKTLAEIAIGLKLPRRAVREKLRRMNLKPRKPSRGPCDCDSCDADECLKRILNNEPLPREECEKAWPRK